MKGLQIVADYLRSKSKPAEAMNDFTCIDEHEAQAAIDALETGNFDLFGRIYANHLIEGMKQSAVEFAINQQALDRVNMYRVTIERQAQMRAEA
jgi:uncharacterized protein (DUF342 family)